MGGNNNPIYRHNKTNPLFNIWSNMKSRCTNPKSTYYLRYGGRGITVCEEWMNDFETFCEWAIENGYQEHLTLDRIDNDGNYEPSNCRWTTPKEQSRNRSSNHTITLDGETKTMIEWCETFNINYHTAQSRLNSGWDYEKTFKTPVKVKKKVMK